MNDRIFLYHAGYEIISQPDIHHGRKNADFGQGFYLTPDEEFARRWARPDKDRNIYIEDYLCEIPAEWGREKCIDYACENDYG